MVFGKIDYLNLLPFYVFMKRHARTTRHHMSLHYKRGVPSKINADFKKRRIDAAFISSITARHAKALNVGIVARKEVLSVLLIPGESDVKDSASATSNVLAKILGLKGEVVIGDNALRRHLANAPAVDLAKAWHERHGLPFVFALLCYHDHDKAMNALGKAFLRSNKKIPHYLLKQASIKSGIAPQAILDYLTYISYEVDGKAHRGLRKFWKLSDTR
jgi:chorismate dehydratase